MSPMYASRIYLALTLSSVALLSACAGMDAQECRDTDWAYLGQLDAMDGKQDITTRAKRHFRTCKENGVQMDVPAYQQGWLRGLKDFCTPESGKAFAEAGRKFQTAIARPSWKRPFARLFPARERYEMKSPLPSLSGAFPPRRRSFARHATPRTAAAILPMCKRTCAICSRSCSSCGSSLPSKVGV